MNYLRLITKYLRNFFKKEPVKVEQPAKKEPVKQKPKKVHFPKCPATLKTSYIGT